ncbi:hypothetical protein AB9P05_13075 [Roseivirga sp. BDSF3-8]|uniref:hypothetical protein n=1 Tax=Roseivirga sp. BDSF3-8 TaxID=3241598 RepID=UPI003531B930
MMDERDDWKFDDLLGEEIRKASTDKAPDDFSLRLMKRMNAEMAPSASAKEIEVKDYSLLGSRGRWFILLICVALIGFGFSLSDGEGGLNYLDQLTAYLDGVTLPEVSFSINFSSHLLYMTALAIAAITGLLFTDKVISRFFGGLKY